MGKILVLYDSKGGYTAKMAEYVANGAAQIPGHEIRLKKVDQASIEGIADIEIEFCQRLGKRLAQWVAYYFDGREDQHPGPIQDRS